MATKLVKVCDICGKEAVTVVKIDVCPDHRKVGLTSDGAGPTSPRRRPKAIKTACPQCGKMFAPQGMPNHMKSAHSVPEPLEVVPEKEEMAP